MSTTIETSVDILLDTNIVIYIAANDERCANFFDTSIQDRSVGLSVITYLEALSGVRHSAEERIIRDFLSTVTVIPLSLDIASASIPLFRSREKRGLRSPKFADILIASTAMVLGIPLLTNNPKDFRQFKGLEILVP
jgi:predicted nucleic acid-binding protein